MMKQITIIGSRPRKHLLPIFSWMIRLAEWSPISHVGMKFDEENIVYDAHFNTIQKQDLEEYLCKHKDIYNISFMVKDSEYKKLKVFFEEKLGPGSGYFCKFFGAMIPQIVRNLSWSTIYLPNFCFFHPCKGWTCSELLKEAIKECLDQPIPLLINHRIKEDNYTTDDIIILAKRIAE